MKLILGGTRSSCATGGAPSCFHLFAARHYCVSRNVVYGAWKRRFGHNFPGMLIPFFAGVDYMPSKTYQKETGRYEERARQGVFLG